MLHTHNRFSVSGMREIVGEIVEKTSGVIEAAQNALPSGSPASIANPILKGLPATTQVMADEVHSHGFDGFLRAIKCAEDVYGKYS